nr:pilus (MSHA type) biogenesis protein MshL [Agaribacterium haliotis]
MNNRKMLKKRLPVFGVLLSALILAACMNQPIGTTTADKEYEAFVDEHQNSELEVPAQIDQALLDHGAEQPVAASQKARFDVSVNRVPARLFFVSLVSESGENVVAHPDIEGQISLDLRNVSIDEVLNVVRDVYGYEYKHANGIYTIYPRTLRTQVFPINYLDVQRVGVTDTSVLIGKITSNSSGSNNSSGNSSSNSGNSDDGGANLLSYLGLDDGQGNSGQEDLTPGTRVQTLNTTDFWSGLQKTLVGIIGGEDEGRFVMTNAQAGIVVVRALPSELSTVRSFLEESELSVQRQVVLETKILEVQLNDHYASGINWGAIGGALAVEQTISGIGDMGEVIFGGAGQSEVLFSSVLGVTDITKLIDLLDQQGDVQVLSSPRISTVNNQKAVIRVGSDEFFVTGISNSQTTSAATVSNTPEIELSSFFSGISLDVTPQIAEDGDVILHVHPIVSKVQDQIKDIEISGDNFSLPLALRDVRESDSIVRAESGQVVVLGGLMQETTQEVSTDRGFLASIPIINVFFKHEEKRLLKNELVILMRPIVIEDGSWEELVSEGRSTFDFGGRSQ